MALLAPESLGDANRAGKDGRRGTGELSRGALGVGDEPADDRPAAPRARLSGRLRGLSLAPPGRHCAAEARASFPWNNGDNYARLLEDPLFALALKNTILFTVLVVGVEIVLAIAIALLLNQASLWTSRLARLLILIPYGVPPITNGLIWSFMYSFQFGFLNRVLFSSGLINEPVNWAGNPNTALYAVAVAYIWRTLPFAVLIIHAALQGIPRELHEAATVDGASAWQRFRSITLPLLTPVIIVILILQDLVCVRGVRGDPGDHAGRAGRRLVRRRLVQLQAHLLAAQQHRHGRGLRLCAGAPRRPVRDRLCPAHLPADRLSHGAERTAPPAHAPRQRPGDPVHHAADRRRRARQPAAREDAAGRVAARHPVRVDARQLHGHPHPGSAEGPHLRAGDLSPRQHQELLPRLRQLAHRRARRDLADGRVRCAVGLYRRAPEAALGALADAGQCRGALSAGDRADDSALRRRALARAAQYAARRRS